MPKSKDEKRFVDFKRPTVLLNSEEHKKVMHFCIDNELKIGEFLKEAALYCVKKKINPKEE